MKFFNLLIIILVLTSSSCAVAQTDDFTIYLVRHSEKAKSVENPRDPGLTTCGQLRSESISHFLSEIELDKVYSTDYVRTQKTAAPTAEAKSLDITSYNPSDLSAAAEMLIANGESALVVGHSNTTPNLAGLLVGKELNSIEDSVYDHLYQVVFQNGEAQLTLMRSAFVCPTY